MNASDSRPEQEIADLAQLLPVPAERELPADRHLLLKEHLMTAIHADTPGFRAARWPSLGRGALAIAAGIAVLAITVAATTLGSLARSGGTIPLSGPVTGPGGSPASALLHKIAAAAGRERALHPTRKQFTYVAYDIALGNAKLHKRQIWTSVTDICKGAESEENGVVSIVGSAPGECPDLGQLNFFPTYKLMASLPTGPGPLLDYIAAHSGKKDPRDLRIIRTVSSLLVNAIAPPRTTAALYRAAATLPGLRIVQHAKDPLGRPGIGVAVRIDGVRFEWIFNLKTLRLLGERIASAQNPK